MAKSEHFTFLIDKNMDEIDDISYGESNPMGEEPNFGGQSPLEISGLSSDHDILSSGTITKQDLVDAGWDSESADEILSDYPDQAERLRDLMIKTDSILTDAEAMLGGNKSSLYAEFEEKHKLYNPEPDVNDEGGEGGNKLGSMDCRRECEYTTGKRWKYADWGFSS